MLAQITVPGSEILPGDVLKRYPSAAVAEAAEVDPRYPNSRTLIMTDGTRYLCSPVQEYVVTRDVDDEPATAHATTPVLCLGPVETPADVKSLRALAYNVAYELGRPAVWATDTDHTVTDYAAVYVTGDATSLRDASTLVLLGEALVADMDVHEPLTADEVVTCDCGLVHRHTRPVVDAQGVVWCSNCLGDDACSWCGEELDTEAAEIVESGNGFYSVHAACLAGIRRDASTSRLHAAV